MDLSRRGVIKKQHELKSMSKRMNTKVRIAVFRIALVCIVFVAITGCFAVAGSFKALYDTVPDIEDISIIPEGYTSSIYFSDGSVSETLIGETANRVYVKLDEIPLQVQQCFLAIEDERFYEHNGIDVKSIVRAAKSVMSSGSLTYGGSTITQQVLKNRVFGGGNEKNNYDKIERKVQEQFLAVRLEDEFTKDQILEAYINEVNLGNRSFGLQVAAQNYFGKDASKLTMSEAAVIAPILLSPTRLNPLNNQSDNEERRMACLNKMKDLGYCTEEEYNEAVNDNVYERIIEHNMLRQDSEDASTYSYYVDTVIEQVQRDLQEQLGMSEAQANDCIYRSGISIITPQDREIQEIMDRYYTDEANFPEPGKGSYYEINYDVSVYEQDGSVTHYHMKDFLEYHSNYQDTKGKYYHANRIEKGISQYGTDYDDIMDKIADYVDYLTPNGEEIKESLTLTLQPQSSMTIIDQSTGHVVAVYGGRGEKSGMRGWNRAYSSPRAVGSTFKVLASFLPALDSAGMTLASVVDDYEYTFPNADAPVRNWWTTGGYRGLNSIRTGIYNSMNVVACRVIEIVTPQVAFSYLKNFGFTTLVESMTLEDGRVYSDVGPALALGGLTKGVTNVELTAAYASIANGGVYNEPIFYTKVIDREGKVLLSNEPTNNQIFKSSTAYLITDAMLDTTTIGTGTRLRFKNYTMPVAGKTGTATGNTDLWFAGYTPYYTASIWTGYDYPFAQTNKQYHQDLWRNIMEEVHVLKQLENKQFYRPDSIVEARVCAKCGNLAVAGLCDRAEMPGSAKSTITEKFAKGTVPTQKCTCHQVFTRCTDTKKLATPSCPSVEEYVYLLKEEMMTTWDTPFVYPKGDDAYCTKHAGMLPSDGDGDSDDDHDHSSDNDGGNDIDEPDIPEQPEPDEPIDLWDTEDDD